MLIQWDIEMSKQYGSNTNTKNDYQKMARKYAIDFLNLQKDYNLLMSALKEERRENEQLRKDAERLRQTITNQKNKIADKSGQSMYMGCLEYKGTK
jgi:predicted  nucleic acid-binding Zn-ribbon protein